MQIQQFLANRKSFHLYPVLPAAVFRFMYSRLLICVHTEETGDFQTKRPTSAVSRAVITCEISFIASRLPLRCCASLCDLLIRHHA
jgi:hypothetical protein